MNFMRSYKKRISPEYKELEPFIQELPVMFHKGGTVIYKGRNELRLFKSNGYDLVVKSYKKCNLINQIVYGLFRRSKAERAYLYARKLLDAGIKSPEPVAFLTESNGLLLKKGFFISLRSECPYQYHDLNKYTFDRREDILQAIAVATANMHENGFLHKDYSGGNILFNDRKETIQIEIIDLNRMSFSEIDMKKGCRNFERLAASEDTLEILGKTYAKERGFNETECISLIKKYNASWIK